MHKRFYARLMRTSGEEKQSGLLSRAPTGSLRLSSGFFDRFPAFLETSETSSFPWRLNLRYEAIFAANAHLLAGARVLDIASHDGRWSFAALQSGARHVTGVEARSDLVEQAIRTFERYQVDPKRYEFTVGDIFDVLAREAQSYDVVLCLGFFYHTIRHTELLARIRATGARHLIVDSEVHRSEEPVVRLATENVARQGNAVPDEFNEGQSVITGRPTLPALELLTRNQGYELITLSDWDGLLRDNPDADQVRDYRLRRRITATFASRDMQRPKCGDAGDWPSADLPPSPHGNDA